MADFPGIGLQFFGDRELLDTTFTRQGIVIPSFVPPVSGFHLGGDRDSPYEGSGRQRAIATQPVRSHSGTDRSGILIQGFYDLFWKDRIHIIPKSKDFGNILSAQQGTFEVYNSGTNLSRHVRSITALNSLTSLGISTTQGAVSFPFVLGLGESEVYEYLVSESGPVVINDAYDVAFDNGVVLSHAITGARIVLLVLPPQQSFAEGWAWITDVLRKADGSEQRISLRNIPRQFVKYEFLYNDPIRLAKLENLIYDRLPNQVAFPYWKDFTVLTAPVVGGVDVVINVQSTTNKDFRVGGNAVILNRITDVFEVGEILTFSTTSITFTTTLLLSFGVADVEVLPVLISNVDPSLSQTRWPRDVGMLPLTFNVVDNKDFSDITGFNMYKTLQIYEDVQYLPGVTFTRKSDIGSTTFDNLTGLSDHRSLYRGPSTTIGQLIAVFENRAEYVRIRNFIHSRRGKQIAFWVSTKQNNFIPGSTNVAPTSNIDTVPTGYGNVFARGIRTDIEIEYADGAIDRREVTNVVSGAFEALTLDSSISQDWSPTNVVRASYLVRVRYDIDSFEFDHGYDNYGQVSFTVKEVQA